MRLLALDAVVLSACSTVGGRLPQRDLSRDSVRAKGYQATLAAVRGRWTNDFGVETHLRIFKWLIILLIVHFWEVSWMHEPTPKMPML